MTEFKIPELGENVATGDVTRVLVNVGDTIARDQPVVELETDKATIEVPSSVAGVVKEIKVKRGDKVKVGAVVLTVDAPSGEGAAGSSAAPSESAPEPPAAEAAPVLVGRMQGKGGHRAEGEDVREDRQGRCRARALLNRTHATQETRQRVEHADQPGRDDLGNHDAEENPACGEKRKTVGSADRWRHGANNAQVSDGASAAKSEWS